MPTVDEILAMPREPNTADSRAPQTRSVAEILAMPREAPAAPPGSEMLDPARQARMAAAWEKSKAERSDPGFFDQALGTVTRMPGVFGEAFIGGARNVVQYPAQVVGGLVHGAEATRQGIAKVATGAGLADQQARLAAKADELIGPPPDAIAGLLRGAAEYAPPALLAGPVMGPLAQVGTPQIIQHALLGAFSGYVTSGGEAGDALKDATMFAVFPYAIKAAIAAGNLTAAGVEKVIRASGGNGRGISGAVRRLWDRITGRAKARGMKPLEMMTPEEAASAIDDIMGMKANLPSLDVPDVAPQSPGPGPDTMTAEALGKQAFGGLERKATGPIGDYPERKLPPTRAMRKSDVLDIPESNLPVPQRQGMEQGKRLPPAMGGKEQTQQWLREKQRWLQDRGLAKGGKQGKVSDTDYIKLRRSVETGQQPVTPAPMEPSSPQEVAPASPAPPQRAPEATETAPAATPAPPKVAEAQPPPPRPATATPEVTAGTPWGAKGVPKGSKQPSPESVALADKYAEKMKIPRDELLAGTSKRAKLAWRDIRAAEKGNVPRGTPPSQAPAPAGQPTLAEVLDNIRENPMSLEEANALLAPFGRSLGDIKNPLPPKAAKRMQDLADASNARYGEMKAKAAHHEPLTIEEATGFATGVPEGYVKHGDSYVYAPAPAGEAAPAPTAGEGAKFSIRTRGEIDNITVALPGRNAVEVGSLGSKDFPDAHLTPVMEAKAVEAAKRYWAYKDRYAAVQAEMMKKHPKRQLLGSTAYEYDALREYLGDKADPLTDYIYVVNQRGKVIDAKPVPRQSAPASPAATQRGTELRHAGVNPMDIPGVRPLVQEVAYGPRDMLKSLEAQGDDAARQLGKQMATREATGAGIERGTYLAADEAIRKAHGISSHNWQYLTAFMEPGTFAGTLPDNVKNNPTLMASLRAAAAEVKTKIKDPLVSRGIAAGIKDRNPRTGVMEPLSRHIRPEHAHHVWKQGLADEALAGKGKLLDEAVAHLVRTRQYPDAASARKALADAAGAMTGQAPEWMELSHPDSATSPVTQGRISYGGFKRRQFELPASVLETDWRVIRKAEAEGMAKAISGTEAYGQNFEKAIPLLQQIEARHGAEVAKRIYEGLRLDVGIGREGIAPRTQMVVGAGARFISTLVATAKVPFIAKNFLIGEVNTLVGAGARATLRAHADSLMAWLRREGPGPAQLSGARSAGDIHISKLFGSTKLGELMKKTVGRGYSETEAALRGPAARAAAHRFEKELGTYVNPSAGAWAKRRAAMWLRDVGEQFTEHLSEWEKLAKAHGGTRGVVEYARLKAGAKELADYLYYHGAANLQAVTTPRTMPLLTSAKAAQPFMPFFKMRIAGTRNIIVNAIRPFVKDGNPGPLLRLAAGGVLAGEAYWGARYLLFGEEHPAKDASLARRLVEDFGAAEAAGMLSDALDPNGLSLESFEPVVLRATQDVGRSLWEVSHGRTTVGEAVQDFAGRYVGIYSEAMKVYDRLAAPTKVEARQVRQQIMNIARRNPDVIVPDAPDDPVAGPQSHPARLVRETFWIQDEAKFTKEVERTVKTVVDTLCAPVQQGGMGKSKGEVVATIRAWLRAERPLPGQGLAKRFREVVFDHFSESDKKRYVRVMTEYAQRVKRFWVAARSGLR